MKKLSLIILATTMSFFVMAQEKIKQKEVGLVFSSLNNFGITYKIGTQKALWRFTSLIASGSNRKSTLGDSDNEIEIINSDLNFGFKFGREYRKAINEKLEFRYGADLAFSYGYTNQEDSSDDLKRTSYATGANLVLGLNYAINNHFIIGAEILPHITYYMSNTMRIDDDDQSEIETSNNNLYYGFSTSSALLSLMYRF
ncbi:MAG: hypothetical protein GQ527_08540 [Bacteroidales bacterium]|nr:hypothetical protein [Bacteroidales bacterium]